MLGFASCKPGELRRGVSVLAIAFTFALSGTAHFLLSAVRESEADVAHLYAEALRDSGPDERAAILRADSRMKRSIIPLLFNPLQSFSGISRHLH